MSDVSMLAQYVRQLEARIARLERQDRVEGGGGGAWPGFADAEGDPAAVAASAADGSSSYPARRDHAHALTDGVVTAAKLADGAALAEILDDDGAGSGLDADLLDGQHAAAFAASSHTHDYVPTASYTAADVLAKLSTVDGAGSGLDADLLDGQHAAAFAASSHTHDYVPTASYTAADVLAKIKTVDGAGSGLDADTVGGVTHNAAWVMAQVIANDGAGSGVDADLLDGQHAAAFAAAAHTHDHGALTGLGDDDHTQYLLASGSRALSANWSFGSSRTITGGTVDATTRLRSLELNARSSAGLRIEDDGENLAIFVEDGGYVGVGNVTNPTSALHLSGVFTLGDSDAISKIRANATTAVVAHGDILTFSVVPEGFAIVFVSGQRTAGLFSLRGTTSPALIAQSANSFATVYDTADRSNFYYDTALRIQNLSGASRAYTIWMFGTPTTL